MSNGNTFTERFNLKGPLILAPLAGGPYTPALAAAVCNAGALGSIGAAYMNASAIAKTSSELRQRTKRPFAINLFIPEPSVQVSARDVEQALAATQAFRAQFKIDPPNITEPFAENFDEQFEAVLKERPAILSYVFGNLSPTQMRACKETGIYTIGAATTIEEALATEASGADAVVCQGVEAGGHRAIFDSKATDPNVSLLELIHACRTRLHIPLLAAGGIMNGSEIAMALSAGAQAAQLGTAFLLADEAGTSPAYRKALQTFRDRKTKLTRAFSGRWARGIENQFMLEMEGKKILPFQAQNKLTRDLRQKSALEGSPEYLSLWAGTGFDRLREGSASHIVESLFKELKEAEPS